MASVAMSRREKFFSHICLVSLLFTINSGKLFTSDAAPIVELCMQTHDQAFCTNVLRSDPRARDARLPYQLAPIIVDLASYNATDTKVKIHNLYLAANDTNLRKCLFWCDRYYADAIEALRGAATDLKQGKYPRVNIAGVDVEGAGRHCEDTFNDPVPAVTSPITNENNYTRRFGEIIAVIANMLDH